MVSDLVSAPAHGSRPQDMLKPETLTESSGGATTALHHLHDAAAKRVLAVLHRSLTTANPGAEVGPRGLKPRVSKPQAGLLTHTRAPCFGQPKNLEAKRQLLFFANSLFNTTMAKPPPVARMKSWSSPNHNPKP